MELIVKTEQGFIQVLPPDGYKIRLNGDNTQSFTEVDIPLGNKAEVEKYMIVFRGAFFIIVSPHGARKPGL